MVRANGKPEVVNWEDRLRTLASFELNCPNAKLTVQDLDRGEKAGVSGCGQRATYVYTDGEWSRSGERPVVIENDGWKPWKVR